MIPIIRKLRESEYLKHFSVLVSGTVIAQAIPTLFYPVLSRLFSPSDFGTAATLTQMSSILCVFATCKYETNILTSKDKKEAFSLVCLIIGISVVFLVSSLLVLLFTRTLLTELLNDDKISTYFYVPIVSSLAIVVYQCFNEWCVREGYFKNLSLNKVINTASLSIVETFFGITRIINGAGLYVGDMIGRCVSALSCSFWFSRKEKTNVKSYNIRLKDIISAAKEHKDCPKYVMPSQLLNIVGGTLPVFLIGFFYGQKDVGFFSMANMVILAPASVISLAARDVFRQKANGIISAKGECHKLFKSNFKIIGVASIVIFGILYLLLPSLFELILGKTWVVSAEFGRILMPMVAISFISEVFTSMMIIGNKLNYIFWWQLLYFIVTLASLVAGGLSGNIKILLWYFSIGRMFVYSLNLLLSYNIARGKI